MSDRVPSDHETVASHRVNLETVGRTSRLRVPLPEELDCDREDVVRLSVEGEDTHAQATADLHGDLGIEGAYANARLARAGEGENLLSAWTDQHGLSGGDPLLLDVVTPGYQYGLRRPGQRVVYRAVDPPDDGLSDIAEDLGV